MYGDISNSEDIMDSRDIIERLAQIEPWHVERVSSTFGRHEASFASEAEAEAYIADELDGSAEFEVVEYEDEVEELKVLTELVDELNSSSGDRAEDGITLIRDSYFEDYARELADELGFKTDGWPSEYVDWERAADALKMDYTSVEFDGVDYWVR